VSEPFIQVGSGQGPSDELAITVQIIGIQLAANHAGVIFYWAWGEGGGGPLRFTRKQALLIFSPQQLLALEYGVLARKLAVFPDGQGHPRPTWTIAEKLKEASERN
jgi:hypothetical protein